MFIYVGWTYSNKTDTEQVAPANMKEFKELAIVDGESTYKKFHGL